MEVKFSQIADELKLGIDSPELVSRYMSFLAGWMYTLHSQYGKLKAEAAEWLTRNRDKYKSYAECERAWDATEDGKLLIKLKHRIQGIEHLQDALKSQHFLLNREWRDRGVES